MAKAKHVHKYILRNIGSKEKPRKVYACALPDCTHFMPSIDLVVGKNSICWKCGGPMVMSKNITRVLKVKPKCYKCRKEARLSKDELQEEVKLDSAIDMMLSGLKGDG